MRKERNHYTAEEKATIPRRHLLDKVPVSDLCEENGLQPAVFYRWQKELFENAASAFQTKERSQPSGRGEAEADRFSGKEGPAQGRSAGGTDDRACGFKKSLGEL
jgi:transposase